MHRPNLTRADVHDWTDERFVERGHRYVAEGRVRHPRRQGLRLSAACQGSQPTPYRVEVTLGDDGIRSADCCCPMGAGGRCKHVAALLLTWIDAPEAFTETQMLRAHLQQRSKDQLIVLIERMLDRHPNLETMVTLAAGGNTDFDPDTFRQRVEQTLQQHGGYDDYGYGGYSAYEVAQDLVPFVTMGDDVANEGDWQRAVQVYRVIAETILDHYEQFVDEEGELGDVVNTCVERMGDLLALTEEPALRTDILRALFDVYRWDVDYGGVAIGEAVPDVILNQATDAERRQVASWVREALPDPSDDDVERRGFNLMTGERIGWNQGDWKRRILGGFLLDLEADTLDEEAYLTICQQTGRLGDLIDRLLERGRTDDALDAVRSASDHDLIRLAGLFVDRGAADGFYDLAQQRVAASSDPDHRLVAWIRDYAEEHDDLEIAFDLSKQLFWASPSADRYRRMRDAGKRLDRWDEERSATLDRLREAGQFHLLTRLHLVEDDVDAALRTVHQASGGWYGSTQGLKLEVARAAEATHPDAATEIYLEAACDLIDQRGRSNYAQAAEYFGRIKHIYLRQNNAADWSDLIEMIRDDNSNLPALQDELDKAGL